MKTLTYQGFNLTAMIKSVFPECSVSLHIHEFYGIPFLRVYVKTGVYSTIMLKMAHSYIMHNIAAPIYRATGMKPFMVNIFVAPQDEWAEDGYNEYDEHPDGYNHAEAMRDKLKEWLEGQMPAQNSPIGTINWFVSDDDSDDDESDWDEWFRDTIGNG